MDREGTGARERRTRTGDRERRTRTGARERGQGQELEREDRDRKQEVLEAGGGCWLPAGSRWQTVPPPSCQAFIPGADFSSFLDTAFTALPVGWRTG